MLGTIIEAQEITGSKSTDAQVIERDSRYRAKFEQGVGSPQADAQKRVRFETVFETMTDGLMLFDAAGTAILVNDAQARLCGYETSQDMRRGLDYFIKNYELFQLDGRKIPPEEWPVARVLRGESLKDVRVRARRLDLGTEWILNLSAEPILDERGNVELGLVVSKDFTQQHQWERALLDGEAKFRALADNIPQLAWMANPDGWIFWYNRRWFEYTNTTLEQMQGWGWQSVHHPDHVGPITQKFKHSLATGEPFDDTFPLRGRDGTFRWFLTRVFPLRDSMGAITCWFGTNTDVTEFREAIEALRRSNAVLEQFAFVAAHDLQEPLRTISLYTEMLLRKLSTSDPLIVNFGDRIIAAAQRMRMLLTDVLTYSRILHQSADAVVPVTDVNEAVAQAIQALGGVIGETKARVTCETLPRVRADPAQIATVFQNLIANALKYQAEGALPEVRISAQRAGERWVIRVHDNGIGFPAEHAERIFGLFKRLHGARFPGTGLGLALSRRIIERVGGRLWGESAGEGSGSTFVMELGGAE